MRLGSMEISHLLRMQVQHKYHSLLLDLFQLGFVSSGNIHGFLIESSLSFERHHQEKMHDSRSLGTTEAGIDNCTRLCLD
jgi:hypothetical protein